MREFTHQGWAVQLERTEGPGHGTELAARAARAGVERVVAIGGDGTVHDVANGLLRHGGDVQLGVVPIGTGNDFAKLVGLYRHSPERAVRRLVTAPRDPGDGRLDVCLVRGVSLPRFLVAVPRVMRGTHTGMREVTLFQAREVTIRSLEAPLLLHLDGELRAPGVHECAVRVEPARLKVMVAR